MDSIYLSKSELGSLKQFFKDEPRGIEGHIYLYEKDKVIKIFKSKEPDILENKYNKIHLLCELNNDNIVCPEKLVYVDGMFAGYSMKYHSDSQTLYDQAFRLRKSELIGYLKKLKHIILKLHSQNIYITDFNPCNFLIEKGNLILCDCDNWCIHEFKPDILNANSNHLILRGIKLGSIMDIYGFNIMTVSVLKRISTPFVLNYMRNNRVFFNKQAEEIITNMVNFNNIETRFIVDSFKEKRLNLYF